MNQFGVQIEEKQSLCPRRSGGRRGESVAKFVQDILRHKLHLPEDFNFQIQRAHHSLAQKPAEGAQPKPIIVNFLEFTTKERVLRELCRKKI